MPKTKTQRRLHTVTHPGCTPYTTPSKSPQNACRKAFRHWLKTNQLARQPKTSDDGGFENVEVEIL